MVCSGITHRLVFHVRCLAKTPVYTGLEKFQFHKHVTWGFVALQVQTSSCAVGIYCRRRGVSCTMLINILYIVFCLLHAFRRAGHGSIDRYCT